MTAISKTNTGAAAVREAILSAASARFARYGFGKTTMAEIAADCAMSAANLYRYFPSKSDIAAAGAERWLDQAEHSLRAAARVRDDGTRARLRRLTRMRIALFYELAARHSHLDELITEICAQRPELTDRHARRVCEIIAGILAEGIGRGEVRMLDTTAAARALCWATAGFVTNEIVRCHDMAHLEQAADNVVDLIMDGLAPSTESGGSPEI